MVFLRFYEIVLSPPRARWCNVSSLYVNLFVLFEFRNCHTQFDIDLLFRNCKKVESLAFGLSLGGKKCQVAMNGDHNCWKEEVKFPVVEIYNCFLEPLMQLRTDVPCVREQDPLKPLLPPLPSCSAPISTSMALVVQPLHLYWRKSCWLYGKAALRTLKCR